MSESKTKSRWRRLFHEFLWKSSIDGLRLLLLYVEFRYAKTIWKIFMILNIIYTQYIIINLTIDYIQAPTEIHMATNLVHVANTPFASVGFCSANKISGRKLRAFAEKVFSVQQSFHPDLLAESASDMENHLLLITGLYVYPYDSYNFGDERLNKLDEILTHMFNSSDYPSREILRDLAPDCEDIVLRALIFGKFVNPLELFYKRMTSNSICCMFNYKRSSYALDPEIRARVTAATMQDTKIKFEANSILNSVQFVLQDDLEDFRYKYMWNNAFQVLLFPPTEYATVQSNTVGEILVDHNSIVEIPVQPKFFGSSYNIHQFSPRVRNCYFPAEGMKLINSSYYSYDECLLICRMRSMVDHCGCVNPSLPAELLNATVCTLLDLPCLTEWKKIWHGWNYFAYVSDDGDELQATKDSAESKRCGLCLPSCDGVNFKIDVNEQPMYRIPGKHVYQQGLLKNISNEKPLAIVKLYFKYRYAQATEEDITGDWVVLLNRFGGIMSLMYGFSLISFMELLYFLSGKWFLHFYRAIREYIVRNREISTDSMEFDSDKRFTIYWNELKSPKVDLKAFEEKLHMKSNPNI